MLTKTLFICALVVCGNCAPTDFELFNKNLKNTYAFACKNPQPRAFKAEKLLEDKIKFSDKIIPHTAVLHRCDNNSGCCANKFDSCVPIEKVEVNLVFKVLSSEGQRYEVYDGKNHTKCGCKHSTDDIK